MTTEPRPGTLSDGENCNAASPDAQREKTTQTTQDEQTEYPPWLATYVTWFRSWTDSFITGNATDDRYVRLKRDHTLRVLDNARLIVATLALPPETERAALLAALLHDVGRFPQYALYRTFSDQLSENHGLLGCRTVLREDLLTEECPALRGQVLAAVAMHNRFRVPLGISSSLRIITDVVRDSDKLDIFPVMVSTFTRDASDNDVVTLHLEDKPGAWSAPMVEALRTGSLARYSEMRYINDFKLLLGSWVFDLQFAASRRLLRERGLLELLLATWPLHPDLDALKHSVRQALE